MMLALSLFLLWFGAYSVCNVRVVSAAPAELGSLAPFAAARGYDVEGTVLLNELAATDREVGYKLKATLEVAPVWSDAPHQHLLRFHLTSLKLYLRGKHRNAEFLPKESVLDSYSDSTFYAHWKNGIVEAAYLDPDDLTDLTNFKKSLLSVFQFQILDGEYNETDISGECSVLYETLSEKVFRKIKRGCSTESRAAGARYRRVSRYTLADALDGVAGLHAEEVVELGAALKARSWLALRLRPALPAPPASPASPAHVSLEDTLRALPELPALHRLPLTINVTTDHHFNDYLPVEEAVSASRAALQAEGAGEGGGAREARAALHLVPALAAASAEQLRRVLLHDDNHPLLAGLCRALGLAGSGGAVSAARDALALRSEDPLLPLAITFLEAFALADEPHEEAVLEVLKLGDEARSDALADSALLAAAAAAPRARPRAHPHLARHVRDALAKSLARCQHDRCRRVRLLALGNLRLADTGELLLQHAEREHAAAAVRLAALDALARTPVDALPLSRLERLADLALDARAPLEVRAAALDLHVVRLASTPLPLAKVASALHREGPHELRRLFWQRFDALADEHQSVRDVVSWLDRGLFTWDARALSGTSSVLVRETGWSAGGWRGVLESVQVARAGLLRRGAVRLRAVNDTDALDVLSVEVWTRGLETIAGGAEGEDAAGGLALTVAGTRMRDISLFDGQAELVGHVWAGTASAATPALRAVVPARSVRGSAPLMLGAALAYRWRGAVSLALDAQAQVSLWWRTARCSLELRASGAALEEVALHTAWGRLEASAALETEPRLRIAADLDFYDKISLCVRASTDGHELRSNVTLQSRQGSRACVVRRRREVRGAGGGDGGGEGGGEGGGDAGRGRSLSLGALNDAACRALRSADEPDSEQL